MKTPISIAILVGVGLLVGGCPGQMPASVEGECNVFTDPGFAVQGKRLKDKQWIGATQEKGVQICKWKRPTQ